jgi:hypothetical protein
VSTGSGWRARTRTARSATRNPRASRPSTTSRSGRPTSSSRGAVLLDRQLASHAALEGDGRIHGRRYASLGSPAQTQRHRDAGPGSGLAYITPLSTTASAPVYALRARQDSAPEAVGRTSAGFRQRVQAVRHRRHGDLGSFAVLALRGTRRDGKARTTSRRPSATTRGRS